MFVFSDAYVTDVKDTKGDFVVPSHIQCLGYNNLINIYMLIKITRLGKARTFVFFALRNQKHTSSGYAI
jgi:hypothetical protein